MSPPQPQNKTLKGPPRLGLTVHILAISWTVPCQQQRRQTPKLTGS